METVYVNRARTRNKRSPAVLHQWNAYEYDTINLWMRDTYVSDLIVAVPDGVSLENAAKLFLYIFHDELISEWINFHQKLQRADNLLADLTISEVLTYLSIHLFIQGAGFIKGGIWKHFYS